jgi:hypothetical protein
MEPVFVVTAIIRSLWHGMPAKITVELANKYKADVQARRGARALAHALRAARAPRRDCLRNVQNVKT